MTEEFAELLRRSGLNLQALVDLLRGLVTTPWVRTTEVTLTIPAGASSASAPHGLRHALNGAVVVGQSDPAVWLSVPLSRDAAYVTVQAAGVLVSDVTVKLRCF